MFNEQASICIKVSFLTLNHYHCDNLNEDDLSLRTLNGTFLVCCEVF